MRDRSGPAVDSRDGYSHSGMRGPDFMPEARLSRRPRWFGPDPRFSPQRSHRQFNPVAREARSPRVGTGCGRPRQRYGQVSGQLFWRKRVPSGFANSSFSGGSPALREVTIPYQLPSFLKLPPPVSWGIMPEACWWGTSKKKGEIPNHPFPLGVPTSQESAVGNRRSHPFFTGRPPERSGREASKK